MAWKTHTQNNQGKLDIKVSELKISKQARRQLLLANEFLKIGYQALDKFEEYVKLNPLKLSADDPEKVKELFMIIPKVTAGCFNLSHGFELLLKCLMKEAGVPSKGSHQLAEYMDLLLEKIPEIESNLREYESALKLKKPFKNQYTIRRY